MAVTISVRGIGPFVPGADPQIPGFFRVEIEALPPGCDTVHVESTCTSRQSFPVPAQASTLTADLPNDAQISCGKALNVSVWCMNKDELLDGGNWSTNTVACDTTGTPTTTTTTTTPPPCSFTVTPNDPVPDDECVGVRRGVTLSCQVSGQSADQTVGWQWDYGDDPSGPNLGPALFVTGNTLEPTDSHNYLPGHYTARLITTFPLNCAAEQRVPVDVDPCDEPCPAQIDHIEFRESKCDRLGIRTVTAIAVPVAGGPPIESHSWQWEDENSATPGGATSHPRPFAGGTSHSVILNAETGGCSQMISDDFAVSRCTTTTTTTTTSTTTTTTKKPDDDTTTSTTSTTTSTTTSRPPQPSCLCIVPLIIALALIAIAAISFLAWGCGGFNPVLLAVALPAAILGIIVLIIWIVVCRDCPAILVLINTFTVLIALLTLLALILALLRMFGCLAGAAVDWVFFFVILIILLVSGKALGCLKSKGI